MYHAPRGTQDILPDDQSYWELIRQAAARTCHLYGYHRIDVPVCEETGLFVRGVGEGTDIVDKEMYSFTDKGNTDITLRPEFTAGVMRAYIEHGMHTLPQPVKLYSIGPAFRYERPQAGRFRQLHQLNVEAVGEQDPLVDTEIISVMWGFFEALGFTGLELHLNSIGCPACRPGYLTALRQYYSDRVDQLCPDCQHRLERNPLRLLDCKVNSCQPLIEAAPHSADCLCEECADHFARLRGYLEHLDKPYTVSHRLVRGLDYYTKTVFEVWAPGIGAQNAICGGGRYDGLIQELGGAPTPGIGVASGLDRLVALLKLQNLPVPVTPPPAVYVAHQGDEARLVTLALVQQLRQAGVPTEMALFGRRMRAQMRAAGKLGARWLVLIGDSEIEAGVVDIKDLQGNLSEQVPQATAVEWLLERSRQA